MAEEFHRIVSNIRSVCWCQAGSESDRRKRLRELLTQLGDYVVNNLALCIMGKEIWDLQEVEVYLHAPPLHGDVFCHCNEVQLDSGVWYFHRTGASYRGGNYKGLDLAFGWAGVEEETTETNECSSHGSCLSLRAGSSFARPATSLSTAPASLPSISTPAYAGILFRTIRSGSRCIEGPCLLVNYILQRCGFESISDLVARTWGDGRKDAFHGAGDNVLCLVQRKASCSWQ